MRRRYFGTGLSLVLLVLIALAGKTGIEIAGRLSFGWWLYLARVVPQVSVSRDGMFTGLGCLILFTVGLHFFLRWFHGEILGAREPSDREIRRWKPRWTASIVAVVILMFAAGIGAAGLTHQVGWLVSSRRPHLVPRLDAEYSQYGGNSANHLRQIGLALHNYMSFDGLLPGVERDASGRPLQSWQKPILPFMLVTPGGVIHDDLPWNDPRNSAYYRGIVLTYLNPEIGVLRSPEGYALSHYAGNSHVLGEPGLLTFPVNVTFFDPLLPVVEAARESLVIGTA